MKENSHSRGATKTGRVQMAWPGSMDWHGINNRQGDEQYVYKGREMETDWRGAGGLESGDSEDLQNLENFRVREKPKTKTQTPSNHDQLPEKLSPTKVHLKECSHLCVPSWTRRKGSSGFPMCIKMGFCILTNPPV
ncbi:hypothetical protein AMECASPLE_034684 [Ameca splendens]|uniref:Uncharacterized protein n=1 Tax=Ameca splendens TaxID=208324 RepID=A0ABV0YUP6_9TELE